MGPLAKFLSISREGHPALDFFLQQFGPRTEVLSERLQLIFQGRNPCGGATRFRCLDISLT